MKEYIEECCSVNPVRNILKLLLSINPYDITTFSLEFLIGSGSIDQAMNFNYHY